MYHYSQDGKVQGPVAADRLVELFDAGTVRPHDPVRLDGTATWRAAIDIVASLRAEPFSVSPSFVGKRRERTRMLGTPESLSPAPSVGEPGAPRPHHDTVRTFLDYSRNVESAPPSTTPDASDLHAARSTERRPPSHAPSKPPPDPFGVQPVETHMPRFGYPGRSVPPDLFGAPPESAPSVPPAPAPMPTRTVPIRFPPGVPELGTAAPAGHGATVPLVETGIVAVHRTPVVPVAETIASAALPPAPSVELAEPIAIAIAAAEPSKAPVARSTPAVVPVDPDEPIARRMAQVSQRPSGVPAPLVAASTSEPSLSPTKIVILAVLAAALLVAAVLFGRYTTELRGSLPPVGTHTTTETTLNLSSGRVVLKRGASSVSGSVALDAQSRVIGTLVDAASLQLRYQRERTVRTLHLNGQPAAVETEDGVLSGRTVLIALGAALGAEGKRTLEGEPPTDAQIRRIAAIVPDARDAYPAGRLWPGKTWSVEPRFYCQLLSLDDGCTGSAQMELLRFVRYRGERSAEIDFHASIRGKNQGLGVEVTLSGQTYRSLERYIDLDTHGGGILRMSGEIPAGIDGSALMDLEGPFDLVSRSVQDSVAGS